MAQLVGCWVRNLLRLQVIWCLTGLVSGWLGTYLAQWVAYVSDSEWLLCKLLRQWMALYVTSLYSGWLAMYLVQLMGGFVYNCISYRVAWCVTGLVTGWLM